MRLHEALLDAHRRLGLTIQPGLFGALSEAQKEAIVALAEAGRRHAKTDLDRLDAAIRTLIDVRYDDDHTRSSARKALDALLNLKDGLGDPSDPDAVADLSDDPEDEAQAVAQSKKVAKAAKAAEKVAAKGTPKGDDKPEAKAAASGDGGSSGGKSIELKIAASDDEGRRVRLTGDFEPTPVLAEGSAPEGSTWDVLLIQPGISKNRRRYRREVLQEALGRGAFDNARAFAPDGPDHFGFGEFGRKRGPKELVGWWTDPRYEEAISLPDGKMAEGVVGTFHVSEAAPWLKTMLADAWARKKPDLVGWSIVGDGDIKVVRGADGRPLADVSRMDVVESIDPVVNPAAGGRTLRLVASKEGMVNWTGLTLAEAVRGLGAGTILPDELKDNRPDLFRLIESFDGAPPKTADPAEGVKTLVEAEFGKIKAIQYLEAKLAARSRLAEPIKARVRDRVTSALMGGKVLAEAEIEQIVTDEVTYVGQFSPAPSAGIGAAQISDVKAERDQMVEAAYKGLKGEDPKFSIAKFYVDLTGDSNFSGKYVDGGRLTESLLTESITTSTFAEIMGDSVTRRMLDYYNLPGLDAWRSIVNVGSVKDFRTYRRVRFGGYGNLPAVAQGDPYTALSTPGDEEATYAISKRGGTEDMTLESIANDDLNAMRDIPRRLGRAAGQTLHEFVFDFLRTNPTIYDSSALFVAGHGSNLGSTALDATTLAAGRLVMKKQTDMSNSKRLGIVPKYLVVPNDLEQKAYELTATDREVASANNTLNWIKTFGLSVIVVDYWTDANNWYLVADPNAVPTIEVAFFNGNQEPELFVQDQPTVGNVFTNDKITYKIRHIYGGAVMDFRGFYGAVVA
jgi:hypothetical protein